ILMSEQIGSGSCLILTSDQWSRWDWQVVKRRPGIVSWLIILFRGHNILTHCYCSLMSQPLDYPVCTQQSKPCCHVEGLWDLHFSHFIILWVGSKASPASYFLLICPLSNQNSNRCSNVRAA